ncbi:c-type cytochrome [Aliamphritea ceti]|uniref:c-type cytochrome n=1 Tax=Aliamphritea ceti TaxID=1524258 RepID=UPI0021C4909F|nr:cytochrome c [Aliamphritea ceti]
MIKTISLTVLLSAAVAAGYYMLQPAITVEALSDNQEQPGNVANGAYLARISGCIACHTDSENNGKLVAGAPLDSPYGQFYAPNLTTDSKTGIGSWTLNDFARAVRQGISPEGSAYYPAFPYEFFGQLSDQDVRDLWAAFRTVPPVNQPTPPSQLSFPYNLKQGLPVWQRLFQLSPDVTEESDRGKYLTEAVGHCAACHTPRNLFGSLQQDQWLQGVEALGDAEAIPAITASALRQNNWTVEDLAYALKTGITPEGDALGGSMGEVIKHGSRFMSEADRQAIAKYLLSE